MKFHSQAALIVFLLGTLASSAGAADAPAKWPWREWIEPDFPFFSITFDGRGNGIQDNLVPRGLVFPLADDCFLAYDVDLLRVAAVWRADGLPLVNASMAVNSYPYQGNKVGPGTGSLPHPHGAVWLQNGSYPGIGLGTPEFTDPRTERRSGPAVGRGGLDPKRVRLLGIDLSQGAALEYLLGGKIQVRERFLLTRDGLVRSLQLQPHAEPVFIVLAKETEKLAFACQGEAAIERIDGHVVCRIPPATKRHDVAIVLRRQAAPQERKTLAKRWPKAVRLPLPEVADAAPVNLETIPLPLANPYGRAVRAAAIDFFRDGRAAVVTFDGDVWIADGLRPNAREVVWTRFTSGLHEPLNICIRDDDIFVFDRSGLWRLQDRDGNGEADYHELFCAHLEQTAETREFASALVVEKEGSFLVAKPGQQASSTALASSAIHRISADGKTVTRVAHGFRQPFLGYDPVSGQIAASDQQGNWVPSTPVAFVKEGAFHGHPVGPDDRNRAVEPPLTWIPHQACASSSSIVWLRGTNLGPLNDTPVLLAYTRPNIFRIHTDIDQEAVQGGVTRLDLAINAPLLHGAVNPADGLLYVVGFKIWGTSAREATYLGRIRTNNATTWPLPAAVRAEQRGIWLQFETPLQPSAAADPEAYQVRRWNYKRTGGYGSPYYRLDGTTGFEVLHVASVQLSRDQRSVFLGVPDMREAMQIEVTYEVAARDGTPIQNQTFLSAHRLRSMKLTKEGFARDHVDLRVRASPGPKRPPAEPSVERGLSYYTKLGCISCHSIDGTTEGKNGPSFLRLYGSKRKLVQGGTVAADDDYLLESIVDPSAKVAVGAMEGDSEMPSYAGVLDDEQLRSLVLFIKALSDKDYATSLARADLSAAPVRQWKLDDFRDELSRPLRGRSFESGKLAFLSASCFNCHQLGDGKGGTLGPDLARLDPTMHGLELLTHILEPSRRVDDRYKSRTVVTIDGKIYTGFLVAEDETEIKITPDPLAGQAPIAIRKEIIDEVQLSAISAMPDGALNMLDKQQILDLLAYIEARGNAAHTAFAPVQK